jgi:hypothetical protein
LLRALAATAAVSLVAFHAGLLARRLAQPDALDALAALRWAGAVALLCAYLFSRRVSPARLNRRQAVALALAALSLHAPALQGPAEAALAAGFWIALPSVLGPALGLLALASIAWSAARRVAVRGHCRIAPSSARRVSPASTPLSPRPPPHAPERA